MIEKHLTVMKRADSQTMPGKVIFRSDLDDVSRVDQEAHWLDLSTWQAMGHPDIITITVEAGDKLNEEDS